MTGLRRLCEAEPVGEADPVDGATEDPPPTLTAAMHVWIRIGLLSFGGPAAQIALMHRLIVAEKGWLTEKQYLNALSFCMLLPGPEAMQLATYAGWRLHGVVGGLIAGLWFVVPGAIVILLLAAVYALFGNVSLISALFLGIKAAVLVVVVEALLRISSRALQRAEHWVIAALAFIGIFFLEVPYPLIILLSAIYGFVRAVPTDVVGLASPSITIGPARTALTIAVGLVVWWLPVALVGYAAGIGAGTTLLLDIGTFFSKLAIVTFGGAYAVLAYLAQDVVNQYGWLSAGEMMDGLGLAETTPGPLILVTEFVGFIAGYREGGLALGAAAALMTLWVTFVPCFLWIFAGAPYIDWIGEQPRLRGALNAITAAVVGVIFNLSIWFALHVCFTVVTPDKIGPIKLWVPDVTTLDWRVVVLSVLCAFLTFRWHWSIFRVLGVSALLGLVLWYLPA